MGLLVIGDNAPNFECEDHNGEIVRLNDYKGKKLVIFFYPKANTPGCTAQACNLSDNYERLTKSGYEVLGVSADDHKKQGNFQSKFKFPYKLLCDTEKKVINSYGVWGEKKFMGREYMGILRATYIIDNQGKIEKIYDSVKTKTHAQDILSNIA